MQRRLFMYVVLTYLVHTLGMYGGIAISLSYYSPKISKGGWLRMWMNVSAFCK